jgi:hypothetical protein
MLCAWPSPDAMLCSHPSCPGSSSDTYRGIGQW